MKICFVLIFFVWVFALACGRLIRLCMNDTFQGAMIEGLTHEYLANFTETNDSTSLEIYLRVSYEASIPMDEEIDGFVVHLQHPLKNHNEPSFFPLNICNGGYNHFWVKTECLNSTSICGENEEIPSGYRLCPITYRSDPERDKDCRGAGNYLVHHQRSISVPANVGDLLFRANFSTQYSFTVYPYYREYFYQPQPKSNAILVPSLIDCPAIVARLSGKNFGEATQTCCELGYNESLPRNITFYGLKIDLASETVSYTVRFLPPLNLEGLQKFQVQPAHDVVSIRAHPAEVKNFSSVPLSQAEKATLAKCDKTEVYHEATLFDLVPGVSYRVQITTIYAEKLDRMHNCKANHCQREEILHVPPVNTCDPEYLFCVETARCVAQDSTGTTTLNATCICPLGSKGNGIRKEKSVLASGCVDINYCDPDLNPCSHSIQCIDYFGRIGANCTCLEGHFGDGYKNGTGCRSTATVVLGVVIPSIVTISLVVAYVVWKLWRRRARLHDLEWSQFVANEALKTYTIANGLNDPDELCMPTFGDKWEVDRSKLLLGDILGRGNYGIVYEGMYERVDDNNKVDEIPVAIKMIKEGADEDVHVSNFLAEIGFMLNVGGHPNVIKVVGCCTTQKPVLLVTDLLKYGDLLHFLWDAREPSICLIDPIYHVTEKSLYQISKQVAEGMSYLTQSRIIHGDLAARNILVGENLNCKISDFGLANDVYRYGVIRGQSERCVPFKWISPERMMAGKVPITSKSDVWSFGNLMYEMVTLGCMPHPGVSSENLFDMLKSGYRMKQPSTCSDEMFSIMSKCWKWKPSSRPSFAKLVEFIDDVLKEDVTDKDYVNLAVVVQELDKQEYEEEVGDNITDQKKTEAIVTTSISLKHENTLIEENANESCETHL